MWCDQLGFQYAKGLIPEAWAKEPASPLRLHANAAILKSK
jgi:hypothetical protein